MANEEYIYKISMMQQQSEKLEQQLEAVNSQVQELHELNKSLGELNGEFLTSLGKGIFAKVELKQKDLFVNIGERVLVKKTPAETQKIIEEQIVRLGEVKKMLLTEVENINQEMQGIIEGIKN